MTEQPIVQPSMAPPPQTSVPPAQAANKVEPVQVSAGTPVSSEPIKKQSNPVASAIPGKKMELGSKFFWVVLALVGATMLALAALIFSLQYTGGV
ncbi:hypothetical protein KJ766_01730 [Patescibacteria group bacterium]|nr:hypothetical protein [Patescibacteria group bacterium]